MRKKTQRIFAGILAVIVSISMVGAGVIGVLLSDDPVSYNQTQDTAAAYQAQIEGLEAMASQIEIDPDNLPLLRALADGYYRAGFDAQYVKPEDAQGNFERAVDYYLLIIETEDDAFVMLNLANVAYYSGNNDLAEQTYEDILAGDPEFVLALIAYSMFLLEAKEDYAGAEEQLERALLFAEDDTYLEQIHAMRELVQMQREANDLSSQDDPDGGQDPEAE